MIIVIMGVSGTGKTSLGKILQKKINIPFYDADDFHSKENINKMRRLESLDDADRQVWLRDLSKSLSRWEQKNGAILACSALKESYRVILQSKLRFTINWVCLYGDPKVIHERLKNRKDHFFSAELLSSQYDQLEVPKYGSHYNVKTPLQSIAEKIISKLNNMRN